jgi:hypothetical protein
MIIKSEHLAFSTGDWIGYTEKALNGFLYSLHYVVGEDGGMVNGSSLFCEVEDTAIMCWSKSLSLAHGVSLNVYPRAVVHAQNGSEFEIGGAALYKYGFIPIVNQRLRWTLAGGGDPVTGTLIAVYFAADTETYNQITLDDTASE